MFQYEIKKVFSKTGSKIALLLLLGLVALCCFFASRVTYIDENGDHETGPAAAAKLKEVRKQWAGPLDEETLRRAIAENARIRRSPQARSTDVKENDIAFGWGQGVEEIRDLLNCAYAASFREYDYYRADSLSVDDAGRFYENRITLLSDWLSAEANEQYSAAEKEYLLDRYRKIKTPFYYDYMEGWVHLFEYSPTLIMVTMLILGYLVSGIFSGEFSSKSDAVFFSSVYGRNKAVLAKIKAGFCITTVVYFASVLLYSAFLLLYFGADGQSCPVQTDWGSWKCFYPVSIGQKYVLIVLGGYVGCLFISCLSMLVSAKTRSALPAVIVPFALIFIPSFLGNINHPLVNKIIGLLPDQLLQVSTSLDYFNLYSLAGTVLGAIPVALVLYICLTVALLPVIYQIYRKKQIG